MATTPKPDDERRPAADAPTAETPLPDAGSVDEAAVDDAVSPAEEGAVASDDAQTDAVAAPEAPSAGDPLDPDFVAERETPTTVPAHAAPRPSVLDRVRANRVGPLAAGLGVGLVVALLLAVLVPSEPNLYAFVVLGLLVTAAVGFTVRYLAPDRGWASQATAFVATAIAIHIMAVTGTVDGFGPSGILEQLGVGGPGFDDALLASFAVPAVSTGGVLSGLAAAIIAGWGPRDRD